MAKKPETAPVRLALDVIESARIVAALSNRPMAEMMSDLLRPILKKMERESLAKRAKGSK